MAKAIIVGASKAEQLQTELILEEHAMSIAMGTGKRGGRHVLLLTQGEITVVIPDEETTREIGKALITMADSWGKWDR